MKIPGRNIERFVREIAEECMVSQNDRATRGELYKNYFLYGAEDPNQQAIYNKTYAYLDDLESLLYSPISLRFRLSDPDLPSVLEIAKGRSASGKLRSMFKSADTDTRISEAVLWSLVKGKSILKQTFKRGQFQTELIQPETFGVLRETHDKLDEDMEAFTHSMFITPYQFDRMIWNHPDRDVLKKRARKYAAEGRMRRGGTMQVTTGGLQPFQPGAAGSSTTQRGIVDWMSAADPMMSPQLQSQLLQLDEVWIWDDSRQDWATFQIIGDDILIMGKYVIFNALAWDPASMRPVEYLRGHHPFVDFAPNRIDGYFWGRSEIVNVAMLQEAINSRINGTNKLLRLQEDPPKRFSGASVNQQVLSRISKPGGYWSDTNPNAKVDTMAPQIPQDLWGSLHEYERMFNEMGGLPPIARGHGDAGVRSGAHADTLVRMFSPRFKDRALLVERDVAALGGLSLKLAKAHVDKKLVAWVPEQAAGVEASKPTPLIVPPAEGLVSVNFRFSDLDEDMSLQVDSHSSSPAFSQDARNLIFDLFKIGAADKADVIEHVDAPDPEGLVAGVTRREIAAAKAAEAEMQAKLAAKAKH